MVTADDLFNKIGRLLMENESLQKDLLAAVTPKAEQLAEVPKKKAKK